MPTPIPITNSRRPSGLDFDEHHRVWWGAPGDPELGTPPTWTLDVGPSDGDTHWLRFRDLPGLDPVHDDPETWASHPSLTAQDRNPSLAIR